MFAIINRLQAIPGYSHGTVVSVHSTELDALIADLHLADHPRTRNKIAPRFVLSLAVPRRCGEHVRLSDLVENGANTSFRSRSRNSSHAATNGRSRR